MSMKFQKLSEEQMMSRSMDKLPKSFKRGGKFEMLVDLRDTHDFYPEEVDELVDNNNIKVCGYNIVNDKLLAIDIKCNNVELQINRMGIKDYKLLDDNENARVWLE